MRQGRSVGDPLRAGFCEGAHTSGAVVHATGFREQFTVIADALAFAEGIVETVREPVLVLDQDLRVIAANRSFYSAFKVSPEDTQGRLLYALGDGQWDIPKLRALLEKILPEKGMMESYEVEHEFPGLGLRTMCLNARQVSYTGGAGTTILLGIEDITERRVLERDKDELLRQKDVLLEELQHRIANSLQIIASIILKQGRCSRKRRVFICRTRTSESCRSLPCRDICMHPGSTASSKLRLISHGCAKPS